MKLKQPFLKLPIRFCADTLAAEIRALPPSAWEPHPQRFAGNEAVPLISRGGGINNDLQGAMAPTEHLQRCPYTMEVMGSLGAVLGRSRLMGLGAGADVPPHIDIHYYWRTHLRVHIPIVTNPHVQFVCGDETAHMAAGECWLLDTFRRHGVKNGGSEQRVHLVIDSVGGERLWDLIDAAERSDGEEAELVPPGRRLEGPLPFEQFNCPKVMSPWEIEGHLAFLKSEVVPDAKLDRVAARLDKFVAGWRAAWTRFADSDQGLETYRGLIASVRQDLQGIGGDHLRLENGRLLYFVLDAFLFANAIAQPVTPQVWAPPPQRMAR